MPNSPVEVDRIQLQQIFPWVRLFRAFGIAVDLRKVILATLAILTLSAGNWAFSHLPFAPQESIESRDNAWPWKMNLGYQTFHPVVEPRAVVAEPSRLTRILLNWRIVLQPVWSIIDPATTLFTLSPRYDWWSADWWQQVAYSVTQLLWALIVWSIFAGAITRIAAVQFACEEKISLWTALKFSTGRFLSYLTAPLLPLVGIGFFWLLCLGIGLIGRFVFAGEAVVATLWIVPMLFAFLMTLMVIGVVVGWPLMFAGISAEGSDAFDGLNRTYSYVYERPWYYLWLILLMLVYGSVVIFFVWLVATLVVYLAAWSVTAGLGGETAQALLSANDPIVTISTILTGAGISERTVIQHHSVLTQIVGGWTNAVYTLVVGFVYSYFWTAVTIIYFLLRKSDDATDFDQVYLPESDEEDDLLPMVETSEADQPVAADSPSKNESEQNTTAGDESASQE